MFDSLESHLPSSLESMPWSHLTPTQRDFHPNSRRWLLSDRRSETWNSVTLTKSISGLDCFTQTEMMIIKTHSKKKPKKKPKSNNLSTVDVNLASVDHVMKSSPDDCSPATKTKQISSQHLILTLISYQCMRPVCVWSVYPPVIHSASKKAVLSFYIIPTRQARFQAVLSSKWPNRLPWWWNNAALIATTVNTTNSKWNQSIAACRVQVLEFTCSFSHI